MLGLVASVAFLSFSIADTVLGYFQEAVAIETRHGVLAEKGLSVTVAAGPDENPVRLAAGRYLASTGSALIVFEGVPVSVELRDRAADLLWMDSSLAIRVIDESQDAGSILLAPDAAASQFLLLLPAGYVARENLRPGERLMLI